jgi:hypothetical protein
MTNFIWGIFAGIGIYIIGKIILMRYFSVELFILQKFIWGG